MSPWRDDPSGGTVPEGAADLRRAWRVSALVQAVGDTLQARYGMVAVRGEISGWTRAASGHAYFTLKDEDGQAALRCAMFRRAASQLAFPVRDGLRVEVRGRLTVYEARGELQLVVEAMQAAGEGALYEQFLRLKARLEAQGWFDAARKRPLPPFVTRVAVVTSLGAAALRDVVTALRRRAPHVEVVILPSLVQGPEAPAQLVRALTGIRARPVAGEDGAPDPVDGFDVAIVCRGGGSLEDLWAFNDEAVVRAVADCAVPVICGVGHETDFTLSDFAADLRAPTPTAAAELLCAPSAQSLQALDELDDWLSHRLRQTLDRHAQSLDRLADRLSRPARVLQAQRLQLGHWQARLPGLMHQGLMRSRSQLDLLQRRLDQAVPRQVDRLRQRQELAGHRLTALDPRGVLERGYAWVADAQGRALTSVTALSGGQPVVLELADGRADARIEAVFPHRDGSGR